MLRDQEDAAPSAKKRKRLPAAGPHSLFPEASIFDVSDDFPEVSFSNAGDGEVIGDALRLDLERSLEK